MESDHGDLGDMIRGGTVNSSNEWRIPNESIDFSTITDESDRSFGDTFSTMRDPLLHELEFANSTTFNAQDFTNFVNSNAIDVHGCQNSLQPKISDDQTRRPEYYFSRMLKMSPERTKISPSPAFSMPNYGSLVVNSTPKANNSSSTSVENGGNASKTPGLKRRKNQSKRVICIPAPSLSNSRPTGEVVPSDHWAWRKYGQKPIKGSPYPRGYYRCSSSKGCSARKQVERSRSDPNMLVVTYTSEHNHPWPTQRNSLAGSTRSQNRKLNSSSKISSSSHNEKIAEKKVEELSNQIGKHFVDTSNKGEVRKFENSTDMEDHLSEQNSGPSYKPFHIASINSDDFFADLGELESDPLQVAFSQGFSTGKSDEEKEMKATDSFDVYDWADNRNIGQDHPHS